MARRSSRLRVGNRASNRSGSRRAFFEKLEDRSLLAAVITVNSVLDTNSRDSALTLREAILINNRTLTVTSLTAAEQAQVVGFASASDRDVIAFNIAGAGVRTIRPESALPTISDSVVIDGYTQPGTAKNSSTTAFNGTLLIELDGTSAPRANGLVLSGGDSVVRGLIINRFQSDGPANEGNAVYVQQGSQNVISGNLLGTDSTGLVGRGNDRGIYLATGSHTIGGQAPEMRNVISANDFQGLQASSSGNIVEGNLFGVAATATATLPNMTGIFIGGSNNRVGGPAVGASNVISGNQGAGISIFSGGGNVIQNNRIGTDMTSTLDLGNGQIGIRVESSNNRIGGMELNEGNVIAFNGVATVNQAMSGVIVVGGTGNSILGNSIYDNSNLAIDLLPFNPTANDAGDSDSGPNQLQNTAEISLAGLRSDLTLEYSVPSTTTAAAYPLRIEFFKADASGQEGKTFVGADSYVAAEAGTTKRTTFTPLSLLALGDRLVATATDANGNTSEFGSSATVGSFVCSTVVVNTNDTGAGSLRSAIQCANEATGTDTISFNIPGSGVQTIALASALPTITDTVIIDGYTQPGAIPNSNLIDDADPTRRGFNGVLQIVVSGGLSVAEGLRISASNSVVRGLVINQFLSNGIRLSGNGNVVEGNLIGTDAGGTLARGNRGSGVVVSSTLNRIGGTLPAARNVIADNSQFGISLAGIAASTNTIQGNFIGTDATGTQRLGNGQAGIELQGASGNTIGGDEAGARNLISANGFLGKYNGIHFASSSNNNVVEGNYIGTDVGGARSLGNTQHGVGITSSSNNRVGGGGAAGNVISANHSMGVGLVSAHGNRIQGNSIGISAAGDLALGNTLGGIGLASSSLSNLIGGTLDGEGNRIAFNGGAGVRVEEGNRNPILRNSIYRNVGLGIDLGLTGVTFNDPLDADAGANNLQNYPEVQLASYDGQSMTVIYTVPSSSTESEYPLRVEFFKADAVGQEGQEFLGFDTYTLAEAGTTKAVSITLPAGIGGSTSLVATATDDTGNTSEFNRNVTVAGLGDGSIFGTKWEDLNGNGIREGNEPALSGVTITLDTDADGTFDRSEVTNSNGAYGFTGLDAGIYAVDEVLTAGWRQTFPAGGISPAFPIGAYQPAFGNSGTVRRVPSQYASIQAAINAAQAGDTVLVAPGTYVENIHFQSKRIVVTSEDGPDTTIIDGNRSGSVVTYVAVSGSRLHGFTLRNGRADNTGGGVFVSGPGVVTSNRILDNQACSGGGGIYVVGGSLIQGNDIRGNSRQASCEFGAGSGIQVLGGSAQIVGNLIADNRLLIDAVVINGGNVFLQDNVIQGNDGDGIELVNNVQGTSIVQNLITGNGGSGIHTISGPANIVNNTIANNAGSEGSALAGLPADFTQVLNNILAALPGQQAVTCGDAVPGNTGAFRNNLVFSGGETTGFCNRIGIFGNLAADPQFIDSTNFHLRASSPAVDAGTNNAVVLPGSDFDGQTRVLDGNLDGVSTVDIGFDELGGGRGYVVALTGGGGPVQANFGNVRTRQAPSGSDAVIEMSEDVAYTFGVGDFGFSDLQQPTPDAFKAVVIASLPSEGALLFQGNAVTVNQAIAVSDLAAGRLSFVPPLNANGSAVAAFTFQVQDDGGTAGGGIDLDPTPNTIVFDVAAVNDPPVAEDDFERVSEVGLIQGGQTRVNDFDVDVGDIKTVVAVNGQASAIGMTLLLNSGARLIMRSDGSYTYDAQGVFEFLGEGERATDSFTYTLRDLAGAEDTATVTITIEGINDAPTAANDSYSTAEDTALVIAALGVLTNDVDVDSGALSASIVGQPQHGTVTLEPSGAFRYVPQANYSGPDSFTYRASDETAESGVATVSITVTPVNDKPVVTIDPILGNTEGRPFVVRGSFSDPDGGDSWTGTIDFGAAGGVRTLPLGADKRFQFTHVIPDDGNYPVVVRVRDQAGEVGEATSSVTLQNAPPAGLVLSGSSPIAGQTFVLRGEFQDPGTADTFTGTVDWGDGTRGDFVARAGATGFVFDIAHVYATPGSYQINVLVSDDDDGLTSASLFIDVSLGAGTRLVNGVLEILGSELRDNVGVTLSGNRIVVNATYGQTNSNLSYPKGSVQRIVANLGGGDDELRVNSKVVPALFVNAGAGNDKITAGGGRAIVVGGEGNDLLYGGGARDVLIGGGGRDQLWGYGGSDLLIADRTSYDNDAGALSAVMAEWSSSRALGTRVANLRNGTGPAVGGSGIRLRPGETVLDDAEVDLLMGGGDSDWFFFGSRDSSKDKLKTEPLN